MKRELTCISCPVGCRLVVEWEDEGDIRVSGNRCSRGEEYGKEEVLAPKRVVTATAAIESKLLSRLPVKTDKPLPKELIPSLLARIYAMKLCAPITRGDILLEDFEGSGVDLVATRSIID